MMIDPVNGWLIHCYCFSFFFFRISILSSSLLSPHHCYFKFHGNETNKRSSLLYFFLFFCSMRLPADDDDGDNDNERRESVDAAGYLRNNVRCWLPATDRARMSVKMKKRERKREMMSVYKRVFVRCPSFASLYHFA